MALRAESVRVEGVPRDADAVHSVQIGVRSTRSTGVWIIGAAGVTSAEAVVAVSVSIHVEPARALARAAVEERIYLAGCALR